MLWRWRGEQKKKDNWNVPIKGSPMYVIWKRLKRLQPLMRTLNKPLTTLKQDIVKAREKLDKAHLDCKTDLMCKEKILKVQQFTISW